MKILVSAIAVLLPAVALANPFHKLEDACPEGQAAFQKTVYAKVQKDCAICHAPGGPGPTFVLPDLATSYLRVKNFVDFVELNRSLLAVRAGNNHCGRENCNEASGKEMKELLAAWWDGGEKSCERFGKYFSTDVAAPMNLPTDLTKWMKLEWDLGSISDDLSGAKFSIEAQRYATPSADGAGAYRFRKPRIEFAFEPIHMKGVRILINGKYDRLANSYETLDQTTAPQESAGGGLLEFPVLSSQTMILLQENATGDQFSLSFDAIEVQGRPQCKALGRFQELMAPQITAGNCLGCHTAKGMKTDPAAVAAFSMDLDAAKPALDDSTDPVPGAQACSAFIQRTYADRPLRSPIVELPVRGKIEHPIVIQDSAAYLSAVQSWMTAEAAATSKKESRR